MNLKQQLLIALIGSGLLNGSAMATIIYTQPFDNTTDQALISNLTNWGFASSSGLASDTGNRQSGRLSALAGQGGEPGFGYNYIQGNTASRANVAWFAGDLEAPADAMSLAQSDLQSLSLRIGHANIGSQTRWLIRIDNEGTDNWFVSRDTYQMTTGISAADFETQNIGISANFTDLTWRPLLNDAAQFDGLINDASAGFDIITNAANPDAVALPTGSITALGVYHWHSADFVATRFDDFTVTAIPEPGTLVLVGIALGSLLFFRRK